MFKDIDKENIKVKHLIILLATTNLIFLLLTNQNSWLSDDYPYIFGSKLYNLIQEQNFYFFSTQESRFLPLYWFITQLIPQNYNIWIFVVVFVYFLSAITLFFLVKELTNNKFISALSSILYSINYSISIKALSWSVFFGHVFNAFLGFLSILVFLKIYKQKNNTLSLFFYFILNLINFFITEGALIYPIICLSIHLLFNKVDLRKIVIAISPIAVYVLVVFVYTGKFLPIFTERLDNKRSQVYEQIFNKNKDSDLYFYRSTYAPRNFKGYTLRAIDNLAASLNMSSLENSLKYFDTNKIIQKKIKENLKFLIVIFILLFALITFLLIINLKKTDSKRDYLKYVLLYSIIFLLYSVVFFRKDINFALSFISSLIISKIIYDLIKLKLKILPVLFLTIYSLPTVIYSSTNFQYFGDFSMKLAKINYLEYENNIKNNDLDKKITNYNDFKYIFYYKNYSNYKNYLRKYEGLSLRNFYKQFNANE